MKTKYLFPLCFIILHSTFIISARAQGTAFTYQGRLTDNGSPANGSYDLSFALFQYSTGGGAVLGPITNLAVNVSNGLFTTLLDFGAYNPEAYGRGKWLEISARMTGAGPLTVLTSRQQMTPAPDAIHAAYATHAENFSGAISDAQLSANIARLNGTSQTFSEPVVFSSPSNTFAGTFSGNGVGITNADIGKLSGGALTWGTFKLSASPGVGSAPHSVVAADVNGDGRVDLISANNTANTLSVLINFGSGGLWLTPSLGVGSGPQSVVAADVNGDGAVDLISANVGASTLSVLTNNGIGLFSLSSSPGVGSAPWFVAAADVNGDGRVDLISANRDAAALAVLTNGGNGGFTISSTPGVGSGPVSIAAADVNGDGRVDLVSANFDSDTISVLTNDGSGGFSISTSPGVGDGPASVAAADVNGDGQVDLICANAGSSTLSVLTNNGSGGFSLSASPGVGSGPISIAAADVNGDGRVDLISANFVANTLSVLVNNSGGGFTLSALLGVDFNPWSVAAADVNGDGRVDLISANSAFSTLSVLLNTATFTGDGAGLTNAAGWVRNGADISYTSGNVTIAPPGSLFLGSQTRQMLNLWGTQYGIGVQNYTMYFRTDGAAPGGGFAWYKGGIHNDGQNNAGGGTTLMTLDNGGNLRTVTGTLSTLSDRNAKANFEPVDARDVLERVASLPITRWNFKSAPAAQRHLGPMAQDFYAAFNVGLNDTGICTVDADGVALAAIQGLNEKVESRSQRSEVRSRKLEERLQQKETEITELKQAVNELKELVQTMNHKLTGGAK